MAHFSKNKQQKQYRKNPQHIHTLFRFPWPVINATNDPSRFTLAVSESDKIAAGSIAMYQEAIHRTQPLLSKGVNENKWRFRSFDFGANFKKTKPIPPLRLGHVWRFYEARWKFKMVETWTFNTAVALKIIHVWIKW